MRLLPSRRAGRPWLIVIAISLLLVAAGTAALHHWYTTNLLPVSPATTTQYFTVDTGSSLQAIAANLHRARLIRSPQAFVTYVRSHDQQLRAGTYQLSPSMGAAQIAAKLAAGDTNGKLLTILPAKRLDQIKQAFRQAGYSQKAVDQAFNTSNYTSHPILAIIPSGASLEGFLYPDSFAKDINTPATAIVRQSLDEMQKHLTPDIVNGFAAQGLNTYQGVTLASIVEQETDNPAYQAGIAQVFFSRLKQDMALQSNVTANYAADIAGLARNVNIDSPYNTYVHKGLPPGPIGNVTDSALKAVAHPANGDYLFFVAGDDGVVHFSRTAAEHAAAIAQYCHKKCGQ